MKLWAVTRVRDEIDILPYTFDHLVSEGVDGILLCDNNSEDGTLEWMASKHLWWADQRHVRYELDTFGDPDIPYYQSAKMTALVDEAFQRGADWVIPFDADECWYSADGRSLKQVFADAPQVDILQAQLHNYFPTSNDDHTEPNPYRRIQMRDPDPAPLYKVAVSRPGVVIAQGNHDAAGYPDLTRALSTLVVGHFPWRTPEQFETKIRNGSQAYAATTLPEEEGAHWRSYGRILNEHGSDALRAVFDRWFFDPEMHLEHKPVPWVGVDNNM